MTWTRPARAASRGRAPRMSWPAKRTSPAVTGSRPETARSSVVLPAPFGPSSTTISPAPTERSTPCSTWILPYPASRPATARSGSAAEIGTHHLAMGTDLGRRPGGELAPEIEHGDAVADVEDEVGVVLDEQDAGAPRRDRLHRRAEPLDLAGREPGRGLVEQQEARPQHQRA